MKLAQPKTTSGSPYHAAVEEMKSRTKQLAVRIIRLCDALPRGRAGRVIGDQIIRSGTSVGANYRAVCRARSPKEFLSKIGVVLEECDETAFWLELIMEIELIKPKLLAPLLEETNELIAIFAASWWTTKRKLDSNRKSKINHE